MILTLVPLFVAVAAAARVCGSVDQANSERLRACYELEAAPRFCVEGTDNSDAFWPAVIATDRQVAHQFAELAARPGVGVPVCLHHWRRARCAEAFPLSETSNVCKKTCKKLTCGAPFNVAGCTKASASPTCVDVTNLDLQCEAEGDSAGLPWMVRHSSDGVASSLSVYLLVFLAVAGLL